MLKIRSRTPTYEQDPFSYVAHFGPRCGASSLRIAVTLPAPLEPRGATVINDESP